MGELRGEEDRTGVVEGGVLAADVEEEEGVGAREDVVGRPLERVLAAPVAVDGHGRHHLPAVGCRAVVHLRQPPHRGGRRLLLAAATAAVILLLPRRHRERRVDVERGVRHLRRGGGGEREIVAPKWREAADLEGNALLRLREESFSSFFSLFVLLILLTKNNPVINN